MDLERLIVKLTADALQYNRTMDAAEARISRFARNVVPLGALIDVPFLAAAGAVTAVGVAMGFATIQAVKLASGFERASISMEVMTGSATVAKEILGEIIKMGIETPFKTTELISAAQILKGYDVANEDLVDTLRVLGDVAQGDADKLNRLSRAYGQVKSAGRLMGQEMLQFINAMSISNADLAKVMGVHPSRVKTMIEEAKVSFGTVVKAFNMVTAEGGRFFQMNERINKTVPGQWSALVETMQLGLIRLGEGFFKAFNVAKNLRSFAENLRVQEGQFDSFFQRVRRGFDDIVRVVKAAVFWFQKLKDGTSDWIKRNEEFVYSTLRVTAVVLAGIVALKALVAVYGLLAGAVALAMTPMGHFVLLLTAIGLAIEHADGWKGVGDSFAAGFKSAEKDFTSLMDLTKRAFLAEDWETLGKAIGLGFKMGFKIAWSGIVAEMKTVLLDLVEWFIRTAVVTAMATVNNLVWSIEKQILGADEANKNWQRRAGEALEFTEVLKKDFDKIRVEVKDLAKIDLENDLAPFRKELSDLRVGFAVKEMQREAQKWRVANPEMAAVEDVRKKVRMQHAEEYETYFNILQTLYGRDFTKWTDAQKREISRVTKELEGKYQGIEVAMAGVTGGAQALAKIPGMTQVGGAQIRQPLEFNPQTLQFVNRLTREMERGQWAGETTDKFDLFMKNLDMINEAFRGPAGGIQAFQQVAGLFPGVPGRLFPTEVPPLIGEKERDFAMLQEFNNLRQAMGKREERLPTAALLGSTEAQDIINKANIKQVTAQDQVRIILQEALEVQKQQRDNSKLLLEELKKWVQENQVEFGGGGDF